MAMKISQAELEVRKGICASCQGSQGETFDGSSCVGCNEGLLSLLPLRGEKKVKPIGLITKQEAKKAGIRVVA